MAYVNPSTQSQSDLITAAIWNQNVVSNMQFIYSNLGVIDAKVGYSKLTGSATFSFTSLSSSYDSLFIIASLSYSGSGGSAVVNMRFNNDTTGTYGSTRLAVASGSVVGDGTTPGTQTSINLLTVDNSATSYSPVFMIIPNYTDTVQHKSLLMWSALDGAIRYTSGSWASASAINRIDITAGGGNFRTNSFVSIFGAQSI